MKYWLITTEFPPIHGGGISTYCWHTAKMLAENNHEIVVFINDYSIKDKEEQLVFKNVRLIRFNPNKVDKAKVLGHEARLSMEFANVVELQMEKEGIPDILETQDYLGIGYYIQQQKFLLYNNFKDLKIVVTVHAPSFLYLDYNQVPLYKFPTYWTGQKEKASIMMADLVLSPSDYILKELAPRLGIDSKNPIKVFNPFEMEDVVEEFNYDQQDIVFFGKLTPQKGCLEMLSYLSKMWDNGFNTPISLIGGGAHFFYPVGEDMVVFVKKKYKKYIDLGLIRFEGNLPPSKLWSRLSKAHVVITPSIVDNLPYAVLETMAMGRVALCSNNGGHTEVMQHRHSGFIFNHEIEGSFEKELKYILSLSKSELANVGSNAQTAVSTNCNYKVVYKQKIEVLNALLKKGTKDSYFPFIEEIEKTPIETQTADFEKGLLSIVIPFYNLGNFVEDTIISLNKIDYKNTEIIIINDGSTDKASVEKLKEVEKKYSVIVYTNQNQGLSETRNFGARKSKGEYLAFLDADDTVSSEYYSKSIQVLDHYSNVSFVGCWAQYFGESDSTWPTFNPEPPYLLTHNVINSSALVYKREDFLSFGLNDSKMLYGMEDYDSVISMVKNGARGVTFPELWWQYRIRKNSMAQSFTKNKELFLYRLIAKKHSSFINQYGTETINLLNHNGPGIYFNNPTVELELSNRLNQKLKSMIKRNPIIRDFAKKLFRLLNN